MDVRPIALYVRIMVSLSFPKYAFLAHGSGLEFSLHVFRVLTSMRSFPCIILAFGLQILVEVDTYRDAFACSYMMVQLFAENMRWLHVGGR